MKQKLIHSYTGIQVLLFVIINNLSLLPHLPSISLISHIFQQFSLVKYIQSVSKTLEYIHCNRRLMTNYSTFGK